MDKWGFLYATNTFYRLAHTRCENPEERAAMKENFRALLETPSFIECVIAGRVPMLKKMVMYFVVMLEMVHHYIKFIDIDKGPHPPSMYIEEIILIRGNFRTIEHIINFDPARYSQLIFETDIVPRLMAKRKLEVLDFLISTFKYDETLSYKIKDGCICSAVVSNYPEMMLHIIKTEPVLKFRSRLEHRAMAISINRNKIECVKAMAEEGFDVGVILNIDIGGKKHQYTPLEYSFIMKYQEIIEYLVQKHEESRKSMVDGITPLDYAIKYGNYVMVKRIIGTGHHDFLGVNEWDSDSGSFHFAAAIRNRYEKIVRLYLSNCVYVFNGEFASIYMDESRHDMAALLYASGGVDARYIRDIPDSIFKLSDKIAHDFLTERISRIMTSIYAEMHVAVELAVKNYTEKKSRRGSLRSVSTKNPAIAFLDIISKLPAEIRSYTIAFLARNATLAMVNEPGENLVDAKCSRFTCTPSNKWWFFISRGRIFLQKLDMRYNLRLYKQSISAICRPIEENIDAISCNAEMMEKWSRGMSLRF